MTELSQVIDVTVNVGDVQVTAAGFGTPLIFDLIASTVFANRVRSYATLAAVAADFATTTKTYKAAAAIFSQARSPNLIKIGRRDVGDASEAAALTAILAEDSDWYCLVTPYKTSAILQALASAVLAAKKIMLCSSEDADVIAAGSADIASLLKIALNNRVAYMWHHQSGIDAIGNSYTVTSGIATVTKTAHGLRVGDPITFSASTGMSINGDNVVASVPTVNTFTVPTTAADEAGPDTVTYFARYTFPECAWAGAELSSIPGSETWKFKQLAGIIPAPKTYLTDAQEQIALVKNANLYTTLGGVGHTHEGVMASGRFIDTQRGVDWTESNIAVTLANRLLNAEKIPYTDAGATILQADIAEVMDAGVRNGLFGPLLDDSGKFYNIFVPKVADQLTIDRTARYFPGITVQAQLAGAVHSLAITVNAQV